jgi:hypothetical protein
VLLRLDSRGAPGLQYFVDNAVGVSRSAPFTDDENAAFQVIGNEENDG